MDRSYGGPGGEKDTCRSGKNSDRRRPRAVFQGKGEFRFCAKVWTPDNDEILTERVFLADGHYTLDDLPRSNEVVISTVLFEDWAKDKLAIQIGGVEPDTFDPDDRLIPFKEAFSGDPEEWWATMPPPANPLAPRTWAAGSFGSESSQQVRESATSCRGQMILEGTAA